MVRRASWILSSLTIVSLAACGGRARQDDTTTGGTGGETGTMSGDTTTMAPGGTTMDTTATGTGTDTSANP